MGELGDPPQRAGLERRRLPGDRHLIRTLHARDAAVERGNQFVQVTDELGANHDDQSYASNGRAVCRTEQSGVGRSGYSGASEAYGTSLASSSVVRLMAVLVSYAEFLERRERRLQVASEITGQIAQRTIDVEAVAVSSGTQIPADETVRDESTNRVDNPERAT